MKLIRMALLYFHTKDNEFFNKNWVIKTKEIEVTSLKIGLAPDIPGKQRMLVVASINLGKLPDFTLEKYIKIPEVERRKAEKEIENIANMIAIAQRCQREISSPTPCVALFAENSEEVQWLESFSGILLEPDAIVDARFTLSFDEKLFKSLSDRTDGVALLAEALTHNNATGKYHEFVRLFERAFRLPMISLEKKIFLFLDGANLGYTRDEIIPWIQFRHPSIHADLKKSQNLVLEADITRYIPRMEQAAYDLLLNKEIWRDKSVGRRNIWEPYVATTPSINLKITRGEKAEFTFSTFDGFGCYPLDLNGILSKLPEGYWAKSAGPIELLKKGGLPLLK
jgi:hypothetical protein